jgi:hypothetical protein
VERRLDNNPKDAANSGSVSNRHCQVAAISFLKPNDTGSAAAASAATATGAVVVIGGGAGVGVIP